MENIFQQFTLQTTYWIWRICLVFYTANFRPGLWSILKEPQWWCQKGCWLAKNSTTSLLTNGYFDSFGSALFSQVCCRRWLICAASPPQAVLPHTPRSADKKRCKQSAAYVWCTVKPPVCRTILYFYRQTSHSTKIWTEVVLRKNNCLSPMYTHGVSISFLAIVFAVWIKILNPLGAQL